jgi:hypothetical protein
MDEICKTQHFTFFVDRGVFGFLPLHVVDDASPSQLLLKARHTPEIANIIFIRTSLIHATISSQRCPHCLVGTTPPGVFKTCSSVKRFVIPVQ